MRPVLTLARREDLEQASRLLEKAELGCLIARSLVCPVGMDPLVRAAGEMLVGAFAVL